MPGRVGQVGRLFSVCMRSRPGTFTLRGGKHMAGLLWTIIVILFVLWLIGFLLHFGGGLIHLILVVAVILLIINLVTGRRAV